MTYQRQNYNQQPNQSQEKPAINVPPGVYDLRIFDVSTQVEQIDGKDKEFLRVKFEILGTSNPAAEDLPYFGTVYDCKIPGGKEQLMVFDIPNKSGGVDRVESNLFKLLKATGCNVTDDTTMARFNPMALKGQYMSGYVEVGKGGHYLHAKSRSLKGPMDPSLAKENSRYASKII